jgi:hypothetical protein
VKPPTDAEVLAAATEIEALLDQMVDPLNRMVELVRRLYPPSNDHHGYERALSRHARDITEHALRHWLEWQLCPEDYERALKVHDAETFRARSAFDASAAAFVPGAYPIGILRKDQGHLFAEERLIFLLAAARKRADPERGRTALDEI